MDSTASLLFGKTRQATLSLLFTGSEGEFYLREIARLTGISPGALQHELRALLRADLISQSKSGNRILYRANTGHPIYAELRAIIEKTSGATELLRQALAPLSAKISSAFIYGSTAKGTNKSKSDVDLMVIGSANMGELVSRLAPIEIRLQREINPRLFSEEEFRTKLESRDRFLTSVVRGTRIMIVGTINEP